jgi:hypothetical protein
MAAQIDRAMQRAWRYWYEDGLTEIAVGGIFLAIGLLFLLEARLGSGAFASLSAIGVPAIVLGGSFLAKRVLATLKERLVYPRTGFVAYRSRSGRRGAAAGVVGGLMGALAAFLLISAPASLAWVPALQGLLVGGVWLWLGYRLDLPRFYGLGLASALTGAAASLAGLGEVLGSGVYFSVQGLATIAAGLVGLALYLRQAHVLATVEHHG